MSNRETVTLDREEYDALIANLAQCIGMLRGIGIRIKTYQKGSLVMMDDREVKKLSEDCKEIISEAEDAMVSAIKPDSEESDT